ncbi:MAG: DUF378 domain-containing protein [Clostridia bacterium]|nr:DUF378 domain-containing protein [Clostridia bacterium]
MLTFISFIIVMLGSLNWFFIAAFQYDFVAGFFGTQASLLSRFVYFIIGMSAFVLLAMTIKNKGNLKVTENSFKEKIKKSIKKVRKSEESEKEEDEDYEDYEKQDHKSRHSNHNESNQRNSNDKDSSSGSKSLTDSKEERKNSNDVPYGYKDFDITQYDD